MKAKLKWIVLAAVVIILAVTGILHWRNTRTIWNDTYVNGNTAGNLYNGGLFCEYDGTLYFANPNDHFRLYSMPARGGKVKKLCDDVATFINVDEHYIYYARNGKASTDTSNFSFLRWNNNSLCRIKKNGKGLKILDPDPAMYVSLLGNYLYYLHYDTEKATCMYRIKIDGSEKELVEEHPYFTCCTDGNTIYYNGLEEDRSIYALNAQTGSSSLFFSGDTWMPVVSDHTAYYMDPQNNYCLMRVDLNTRESRALTKERIDCFNITGSYIYYARNEDPALCRMKIDGSEQEVVAPGIYTDINASPGFVFFRPLNDPDQIYTMPVQGPVNVTVFSPSIEK